MGALCPGQPEDRIGMPSNTVVTPDPKRLPGATDALRAQMQEHRQEAGAEEGPVKVEKFKLPPSVKSKMMRQLFEAVDTSGDGFLDTQECKALAQAFQPDNTKAHISKKDIKRGKQQPQLKVTESQLQELMKNMDTDNDGQVDFDEFTDFFTCILDMKFAQFDVDNSRTIDKNEVQPFIDQILGVDAAKKSKTKGVTRTLTGQSVRPGDAKWLAQKREQYLQKMNMDNDDRVTADEFQGFVLAVLSQAMSESDHNRIPDGLRSMVDLNMKHVGKDLAAHRNAQTAAK